MTTTRNRVLALLLALTMVFSVASAGVFAAAYVLNAGGSVTTLSDGSAVISVNSLDDAAKIMKESPNLFSGKATADSEDTEEVLPTIILPGISQSISYLADENGNPAVNADGDELSGGLLIIDESKLVSVLGSTLLLPLSKSLIKQEDDGLSEAVYSTVSQLFSIQASDKSGTPVNNLKTVEYNCPVSEMTEDDRNYFYRMIPMQSIKDQVGEDNLYVFAFPLIGDPMTSAEKLDEYIQMVKEQRGVDKVNIATISLGGTILTAYLELKKDIKSASGEYYEDINRVINVVACLQGTDIMGDFYLRNFDISDEFLYYEYLPLIMEENSDSAALGHICNILIRIFPKKVFYAILTAAIDGLLDTLMLNCPQFWSMIPTDRFDEVMAKYDYIATDPEYAELYKKLTAFQEAKLHLEDNLKKLDSQGVLVQSISGYGLDYSKYDYNFFAIMNSSKTTNSDGIIDIDSTSLGATYAPAGELLPDDYAPTTTKYISPDGSIDASTCLFPEHCWFFQGQHHEVGRNDVVIKLVGQLITGEIKSVADKADAYPQYNGNRNTKNIFRWYLNEADEVFEEYALDNTKYDADDIAELHAAYNEATALLNTTICDPDEADATTERLLNALRAVGKRKATEDNTMNELLDKVAKFLDDVIYSVFGGNGFSDTYQNGVFGGMGGSHIFPK